MANQSNRHENHSRQSVPEGERASSLNIALITAGIGTTLPVFWLGGEVVQGVGTTRATLIFFGVCSMLGVLSFVTGIVGMRTRLSTYMLLQFSFGRRGAASLNLLIAVILIGFYGATVDAFGQAVSSAVSHYPALTAFSSVTTCTLIGSALMTLTAVIGIRGLERLSLFTVPAMMLFICYVLLLTADALDLRALMDFGGQGRSVAAALSSTVGMVVMMPVLMPDVTRFAHDRRGCVAGGLGIALGFPLVFLAGGLPSILTGQTGFADNMALLGIMLPAIFIIVFSNWITNTANLYSCTLTLASVTTWKDWKLTLIGSLVGTGLALAGFMQHFQDFVFALSIVIPPIASIYLVDFFLIRSRNYRLADLDHAPVWGWAAIVAWCVASIVAALTSYSGLQMTSIPTVDAMLTGAVAYPLLDRFFKRAAPQADRQTAFK